MVCCPLLQAPSTLLKSSFIHIGHAVFVNHMKWNVHPSQVPSGHFGGSLISPSFFSSWSQRRLMMVCRPPGHALVTLSKKHICTSSFLHIGLVDCFSFGIYSCCLIIFLQQNTCVPFKQLATFDKCVSLVLKLWILFFLFNQWNDLLDWCILTYLTWNRPGCLCQHLKVRNKVFFIETAVNQKELTC